MAEHATVNMDRWKTMAKHAQWVKLVNIVEGGKLVR